MRVVGGRAAEGRRGDCDVGGSLGECEGGRGAAGAVEGGDGLGMGVVE